MKIVVGKWWLSKIFVENVVESGKLLPTFFPVADNLVEWLFEVIREAGGRRWATKQIARRTGVVMLVGKVDSLRT